MSVVFDFNASLNDSAPVYPILSAVDVIRMEKSELLMDFFCVSFFLLYSQCRLSFVSVVFDFNASLNSFAPVSLISLSVYVMRKEKSDSLMDALCSFSFFVFTTQIEFSECCV